jgi:hypothetical protein
VDDHRQAAEALRTLDALQQLEAAAVLEPEVEHHAVEVPTVELGDRLLA